MCAAAQGSSAYAKRRGLIQKAGSSEPIAAIGNTTAPTRVNVPSNPDAQATSAHNPVTNESAFANERSSPSGLKIEWAMAAACSAIASGTSHRTARAALGGSVARGHPIQAATA